MPELPFWRRKTLAEMTSREWESLCDGCGKCCLLKLEDADTGVVDYTDVGCRLLDLDTCRCANYPRRQKLVPDCVILSPEKVGGLRWMPSTCAYRLIHEGKDLPRWHHLVSGDPDMVHREGHSVRGRAVPERKVPDRELEDHIVTWPDL